MPKPLHHLHPALTLESRVLWTFKSTESLSMLLSGEGQDTAIISNLFSENSELSLTYWKDWNARSGFPETSCEPGA